MNPYKRPGEWRDQTNLGPPQKKVRQDLTPAVQENAGLVTSLASLSDLWFQSGDWEKGKRYGKAAFLIAHHDRKLELGRKWTYPATLGKNALKRVKEWLKTGKIAILEKLKEKHSKPGIKTYETRVTQEKKVEVIASSEEKDSKNNEKVKLKPKEESDIDKNLTKRERCLKFKENGNEMFKKGFYDQALQHYQSALEALGDWDDDELTSSIFGNRAACYLKDGMFESCIQECKMAKKFNRRNVKAY